MVKELEKEFIGTGSVKGFKFTQIEKSEKGYIYLVEFEECKHYEVFELRTVALCIDFEKRIYSETDEKVVYPKDENWGKWAYTTLSLEEAKRLLNKF